MLEVVLTFVAANTSLLIVLWRMSNAPSTFTTERLRRELDRASRRRRAERTPDFIWRGVLAAVGGFFRLKWSNPIGRFDLAWTAAVGLCLLPGWDDVAGRLLTWLGVPMG